MIKKHNASSGLFSFALFLMCAVVLIAILAPILNILAVSLSNYESVARGEVGLLPANFSLRAYESVFKEGKVIRGLRNSVFYTILGTAINIVLTTLTAYPLSRSEMPLRKTISMFMAFTMFFSGGMIPTFLLVNKLGLYNKVWSLVLPHAMSVYNMIVMRSFFQSIPTELTEAARIDGANDFHILGRIIIPLSKASIATIALFYSVSHWNSWFDASIYLKNSNMYTLQLVLRDIVFNAKIAIQTGESSGVGSTCVQNAALFISMIPMMALYPFVQKYFVKGVMIGSVKG